jgi:transposase-like protein
VDLIRYVVKAVVLEGLSVREVAAAHGVSRSWVYECLARYRADGEQCPPAPAVAAVVFLAFPAVGLGARQGRRAAEDCRQPQSQPALNVLAIYDK